MVSSLTVDSATGAREVVRARRALPYLPALDGLRAVAVVAVLLYHGGVAWLPGGFLGVDLFFCLSGYLITSLLLDEWRSTGRIDLLAFWARRARRLLPAVVVVIVVSVAAAALLSATDLARTRGDAFAALFYVDNWYQLLAGQSYFAAFERPSLLRHLWSLSIEEQFYVVWPLLLGLGLARIGARRTAVLAFAAALASGALMALLFTDGSDPSRVYYGTDTHASGLLAGAVLAFLWPLGRFRTPPRRSARLTLDLAAAAALTGVVLAMATWHDYDAIVYRGGILAFSFTAVVLIAAVAHPGGRSARVLGAGPLRWIGARSYGIYLWHWPVMAMTRPGVDVRWPGALLLAAQIAATLALAAASYRWVERPFRSGSAQRTLKAALARRRPRHRLAMAVAAVTAVVAAVTAVTVATPRSSALRLPERSPAAVAGPAAVQPAGREAARPLAVGASVMVAATSRLARHATVDAAVGRQPQDIVARLQRYRVAGALPGDVVVQIGENGPLTSDVLRELRAALSGVRRVVLVTVRVPRSWSASVNAALARAAATWPQARLADWYDASAGEGLLYDDGTHPRPRGQKAYVRVVREALGAA